MKRMIKAVVQVAVLGLLVAAVHSAPLAKPSAPQPGDQSLAMVRQEITSLMQERDLAIQEFNARYASAPLSDRVSLEAEGAQLIEQYERQYLELLVVYHRLDGNTAELTRAEEMLANMKSEPATRAPLNLERNQINGTPQGGASHER